MAKLPRPSRKTKSSNAAHGEPPVTPGQPVQTGANIVAAQPTTVDEERAINGQDKDGKKLKPMPKTFAPEVAEEGHRVVLRHEGQETAFRKTDDAKAYDEAMDAARQQLWDATQAASN